MPRCEVKLTDEDCEDIDRFKIGTETRSLFIYRATIEKLNREKGKDKAFRAAELRNNMELLRPVLEELMKEYNHE